MYCENKKQSLELAPNNLLEKNNLHSMNVGMNCRFAKKINFIHFYEQCTTKIGLRKSFFSQ